MATSSAILSARLPAGTPTNHHQNQQISLLLNFNRSCRTTQKRVSFRVQAAKLPAGVCPSFPYLANSVCEFVCKGCWNLQVELPKVEPKFSPPFLGFTTTAEVWNSRACMIGLIGTFIVELVTDPFLFQFSCFSFCFDTIDGNECKAFVLCFVSQIINKGILQVIGVDIGKGLDLPL
ncbi:hypothetical protein RJ639_015441 [Escallonia herrerae]|uniref:Uncharacterized protein n=1 Tax=Escallonia herrerae TaxID=1293975 RepID=A0AA89ANU6_9ASTE|nr:hypothetical protein RJ639_015441 [Escallonia herrerae]